jgi:ATP-binding cassette subfamily B protein/subfamily B ATP-binding cassette protein MsbA
MHSLRKLIPHLRPYRWHLVVVIISALGITAANLVNPWLVRELVQIIRVESGTTALNRVTVLAVILAVVFGFRALFRFLYSYIAHVMAYSFVGDMRVVLYSHLQRLSARFFADRQTGELLKRVISDTQDIEPLIAHYIPDMVVNILLLLGVGLILFSLNPALALLTLLPMPLLFLSTLFFGNRMRNGFRDASKRLGTLVGVVQDNLVGIKEIQIFTQEPREYKRIYELSTSTIKTRLYALKMQAFLVPSIEFLTALGLVIVVLFGGQSALERTMPVEDLIAFVLYLGIFYQPITMMAQMNEMLHVAIAGAERVVEVLDIQPDIDDAPGCIEPLGLRGEIEFRNVRFDYIERMPTLHDISFQVQPGQTLALVGPTGAGKTTIANLVPRFYDVVEGSVTIDGVDVRAMSVRGLRANISMVMQDVFLFNGTIHDNIRYSNLPARDEDIIEAAQAARVHNFILSLPQGYETEIGERGVKLSGGQKQRLAIARAVLKNAPILILDEATSAVDTETEAEIQEVLNQLMKGRTSIVIAHRLSTIRNADQIIVLDEGRIVEKGRHDDLVFAQGRYQRLHEANAGLN